MNYLSYLLNISKRLEISNSWNKLKFSIKKMVIDFVNKPRPPHWQKFWKEILREENIAEFSTLKNNSYSSKWTFTFEYLT